MEFETLTMEQYLAFDRIDTSRGVRKPKIERNVDFEIKGQFLRELKDNTFSGDENEDAYKHVGKIIEIVGLFNIPDVSKDAVMLREGGEYKPDCGLMSMINEKLKSLGCDMRNLKENVDTIQERYESCNETYYEDNCLRNKEVRYTTATESRNSIKIPGGTSPLDNMLNLEDTFRKLLEESSKRQDIVVKLAHAVTTYKSSPIMGFSLTVCSGSVDGNNGTSQEKPIKEAGTFSEKVKRSSCQKKIKEVSMVKLNARCSAVLQNELLPKEKDPGSFILPCTISNTTVSNALANLGSSISVMPFSMFECLGLGNPKPIRMVIEIADRSMQSPKGIVENVLVKIDKFIFLVDSVILDIVEDDKVPIILGRPMLATAHARIDVYGKKISLEVRNDKVLNPRRIPDERDLNGDLESFFQENNLLQNGNSEVFLDSDNGVWISLDDFDEIEDLWDDQDPESTHEDITCKMGFVNFNPYVDPNSPINIMSEACYNMIMNEELAYVGNNIVGIAKNLHVFIGCHTFLIDFIILENIREFIGKGLTKVLCGKPFKDHIGLEEDVTEGVLWFQVGNDKTSFNMPRALSKFDKLTPMQHNMMGPIMSINVEDKERGIYHPYQKKSRNFIEGVYIWVMNIKGMRKIYSHGMNARDLVGLVIMWVKVIANTVTTA
ncbi:homeodomain-like protein [Tanacetum coccineum]|uniref:Homeodomain-like protein n=1 Tax=Tanacetum coccineum TaxID=301880 RepID=A0ABQ5GUK1_9ASTR